MNQTSCFFSVGRTRPIVRDGECNINTHTVADDIYLFAITNVLKMRAPDEFPERLLRLGEGVDASLGATRGSKMPRMLHQCAVYISLSHSGATHTHTQTMNVPNLPCWARCWCSPTSCNKLDKFNTHVSHFNLPHKYDSLDASIKILPPCLCPFYLFISPSRKCRFAAVFCA